MLRQVQVNIGEETCLLSNESPICRQNTNLGLGFVGLTNEVLVYNRNMAFVGS